MLGERPSKKKHVNKPSKKKHVNKFQMSRRMLGAASKITNKHSFEHLARKMRSPKDTFWLPTTKRLCRLLSGEGPWIKKVLEKRLVPRLLYFLTVENEALQVEAAKALKYFASGTSEVVATQTIDQPMKATYEAYDALCLLLHSENFKVLSHACCSLAVLSGCKDFRFAKLVLKSGLLFRIYGLTRHPILSFVALRTFGNLLHSDASIISELSFAGVDVLGDLKESLIHGNLDIRREACWVISYIVAGSCFSSMQDKFFDDLIEPLVNAMNKDKFVVVEAAVWAISNATFGATSEQIKVMVKKGCIDILCQLLCCRDPEIFEACLEGLENILKVGEEGKGTGVNRYVKRMDKIEGWTILQVACGFYQKKMLYKRSLELMVRYGILSHSSYKELMSPRCGNFAVQYE